MVAFATGLLPFHFPFVPQGAVNNRRRVSLHVGEDMAIKVCDAKSGHRLSGSLMADTGPLADGEKLRRAICG